MLLLGHRMGGGIWAHTHTYLGREGLSGVEWGCMFLSCVVWTTTAKESPDVRTLDVYTGRSVQTPERGRRKERKKNDGTNLYRTRYAHTPFMFRTPVPPYCAFLSSSINRVLFSSDYPSKV